MRLLLQTSFNNQDVTYDTLFAAVDLNSAEIARILDLSARMRQLAADTGEASSVAYLCLHDNSADWCAMEEIPEPAKEQMYQGDGVLVVTEQHDELWESLDEHLHRMDCDQLCVSQDKFWWQAIPKFMDASMTHETIAIPVSLLQTPGA